MKRVSFCLLSLASVAALAILHVEVFQEYFGDGPPYFHRTANMDKWRNPIPALAVVDGVVLVAGRILWRWINRISRCAKR